MTSFDPTAFAGYLFNSFMLEGIPVTVGLTAASITGGLILGMIIAAMRASGNLTVSLLAKFYIWLFRGTPLLVQLVVIYTGLPQLGIRLDVLTCALLGLILNEAAYLSEIVRSGFMAVPKGQTEAAWALSLSRRTTFWKVTFPQAFRLMIPPLGNSVNGLLKATSLASVISVEEILRRSDLMIQAHYQVLEVYAAATVYYLLLTSVIELGQRRLEGHFGKSSLPYERH